jgi:hypothetical protein
MIKCFGKEELSANRFESRCRNSLVQSWSFPFSVHKFAPKSSRWSSIKFRWSTTKQEHVHLDRLVISEETPSSLFDPGRAAKLMEGKGVKHNLIKIKK